MMPYWRKRKRRGRRKDDEDAEEVARGEKGVPQRLKPRWPGSIFGTAEAVPLSKTKDFQPMNHAIL